MLDDDRDVATTFERILRSNGYDAVAFTSSQSAFDHLTQDSCKFDLVISDIRMPLMDGIEFAHKVNEQLPSVRIILVTAFAIDGPITAQMQSEGVVSEVLHKPIGIQQLLGIVTKHSRNEGEILDRIYCYEQCMAKFIFTSDVAEHRSMSAHKSFSEIPPR